MSEVICASGASRKSLGLTSTSQRTEAAPLAFERTLRWIWPARPMPTMAKPNFGALPFARAAYLQQCPAGPQGRPLLQTQTSRQGRPQHALDGWEHLDAEHY